VNEWVNDKNDFIEKQITSTSNV